MLFKITPATTAATTQYRASAFRAVPSVRDEREYCLYYFLAKKRNQEGCITKCPKSGRGQNPQMPHEERRL
jgi:hypothetical protein